MLAEFQGGQSEQSQDNGHDPEPHGDGVLFPAGEFKMVMQRRHLEDALAGQLEARHLQNHREGLGDKNTSHDG